MTDLETDTMSTETMPDADTALADFLGRLEGVECLGPGDPGLGAYADPYAFDDAYGAAPAAAVLPTSVEQVQLAVHAAAAAGVHLWPVSTGRNLGYGGASAKDRTNIVLDLHNMNRVLEIDVAAGTALVEPGVTFMDLYDHLVTNDIPLMMSVPDIGWGSVVGNALERGFGYSAYGEHATFRCGIEAVLADGTLLRTGMGGVTGGPSFTQYRGGSGPALDGLFQQSNLGVVTKMGVWLAPRPDVAVSCTVSAGEDALERLVDALHPLMLDETIPGTVMIGNALAIASMIAPRAAFYQGTGVMPADARAEMMAKLGVGFWNAKFGLYGRAEVVAARQAVVREVVDSIEGATLVERSYPAGVDPTTVHPADRGQLGIPSLDLLQMAGWSGGEPAHIDFSLVCPPDGSAAAQQVGMVRSMLEDAGFDHAGGVTLFRRHAIALSLMSFDRSDATQRDTITALFPRLITAAREHGWAPYRAHLAHMDQVADQYDFGDHAQRRVLQTLKAALDPLATIAPGKQGV